MGFSANQARFLSLTSRQVDLEYRMQQICHRRLRLASELEKVATEYNNALSDRKLFSMDTAQSISALTATTASIGGGTDNAMIINDTNYALYYVAGGTNTAITDNASIATALNDGTTEAQVNADQSTFIEEGLRNGTIILMRPSDQYTQQDALTLGSGSTAVDYEQVDWRTTTEIADELWKANDVDAETEYEAAVEKVNSQDKKLQLEQSQIEVEHKAIITQKDAVKSVITKNIESSFKTFS